MRDELAGLAQGSEHVVEVVQRGGHPSLLQPEQDLVDAGRRVGLKDLIQAPERRYRVRELVAVDQNSRQRKMGVTRAPVGVEAERASRLQGRRQRGVRLRESLPCRTAMRAASAGASTSAAISSPGLPAWRTESASSGLSASR